MPIFGGKQQQTEPTGIPKEATDRLQGGPATSDLSVDELVCLEQLGYDPLGLVLGSSIYHIGWQRIRTNKNEELQIISKAMYDARRQAITRMEQEAHVLGADGIVGVHMAITRRDWGPDLLEFLFLGTAIRGRNEGEGGRPAHGWPFSSDLSGQDFWKLRMAGFKPVRLVIGSCVYHVSVQSLGQWFRELGGSTEHVPLTLGTYAARELAMARMEAECTQFGGTGVTAVKVTEVNNGWGSHIIEFFAVGTAIIKDKPAGELHPTMVVSLDG